MKHKKGQIFTLDIIAAVIIFITILLLIFFAWSYTEQKIYENEVRKGGVIFVNSSLIRRKVQREDVETVYIPATEIADELGQTKATNMVMVGAYAGYTGLLSLESVLAAAKNIVKRKEFREINKKAIKKGIENVRNK